jgi:prefoldin beta subunit
VVGGARCPRRSSNVKSTDTKRPTIKKLESNALHQELSEHRPSKWQTLKRPSKLSLKSTNPSKAVFTSPHLYCPSSLLTPLLELSNNLIPARQKLDSQHSENTAVQKEFSTLSPTSQIYKAVGPVLLKQDQAEAKATVDGRIEYIEKEISRIEGQIEGVQKKMDGMRGDVSLFCGRLRVVMLTGMQIYNLQNQVEAMQQQQGQAVGAT